VHSFVPDGPEGGCAVAVADPVDETRRAEYADRKFESADRKFEQKASHLVTVYDKVTLKEDQSREIRL
jgi:hypothetical protein